MEQVSGGPVLEIQDLRTIVRQDDSTVHAVDRLSLVIRAGETVGLVGESGSGKSMTALSIMRLLPPRGSIVGGSIVLGGRDITQLSEREMRRVRGNDVAMIFQDPLTSLNPTMTIGDQIVEAVLLHRRIDRHAAVTRAEEVLRLVRVPRPRERLGSYPHQLSGGLRQRVMIAIALSCNPRLLIADEPTTALDVTIQAQILDLIDDLKRRLNMAVLLITHDLGVVAGRADRVSVMYAGRILEHAPVDDLFSNTHHPYTEALMAALPTPRQSKATPLYAIAGQPPDLTRTFGNCVFADRCRYAQDDCLRLEPGLTPSAHAYACFHPIGDGAPPSPAVRQEVSA
jgi:oligopeptide/dipeptide ABC transporter ATP-binding protein